MSYALDPHEPVRSGVRRIAREQADKALEGLRSAADDREAADDAIHDARKRFKKIRAVLRLVRDALEGDAYTRENEAWRDAGRLLADVRESAVVPGTVRSLAERYEDLMEAGPLERLAGRLDERHAAVLERALAPGGPLERALPMAEDARERIDGWPLEGEGWEAMAPGLERVYGRGRQRMPEAYHQGTGPAFHEWRKRAKYLWYHLRILAPAWPAVLEPLADAQHDLTDLLGDGNDLTDLLVLLEEEPALVDDGRVAELLGGAAERRRRELWDEARPLGRRLWAEEPDAFVVRLGRYREAAVG